MPKIYVIHENNEWILPLRRAFKDLSHQHEEWFLNEGTIPFDQLPPEGVFYNRMSASSHTRGHRFAPELTHGVLNWLESHHKRLINGTRALYFEVSKLAQYAAFKQAGIQIPRTIGSVGTNATIKAAKEFGPGPWILKPNRGGKGAGVQLFKDLNTLTVYLEGPGSKEEAPIDGTWLIQEYISSPDQTITRAEFVGGKYLYSVEVDTSGGFDLCPADACSIGDTICPVGKDSPKKFKIRDTLKPNESELIKKYEQFLLHNQLEIVGIEYIQDAEGNLYTYDLNTNTNYNTEAEQDANTELSGMEAVAKFLLTELNSNYEKKTVTLALGSGGARGIAHIGVIKWLEENDYSIQSVAGSSVGSLVGGVYAAGELDVFEEWVCGLSKIDILSYLDLTFSTDGVISGEKIINTLKDLIGDVNIEDLPIPFTAVATDIEREKEVWINKGSLFDAIRASISMPLFFTPFNYKGAQLIDGGVLNPVPIAPTLSDHTQLTIAVDLHGPAENKLEETESKDSISELFSPIKEKVQNFLSNLTPSLTSSFKTQWGMYNTAQKSLDMMQGAIARHKLATYPPDILIELPKNACQTLEFDKAQQLIDLGYNKTKEIINKSQVRSF